MAVFIGFAELIGASLSSFSEQLPVYEENLDQMRSSFREYLQQKGIAIPSGQISEIFNPSKVVTFSAGVLGQLGGFMGNALTIIFLLLFYHKKLKS